jgi:hypothetical protein
MQSANVCPATTKMLSLIPLKFTFYINHSCPAGVRDNVVALYLYHAINEPEQVTFHKGIKKLSEMLFKIKSDHLTKI